MDSFSTNGSQFLPDLFSTSSKESIGKDAQFLPYWAQVFWQKKKDTIKKKENKLFIIGLRLYVLIDFRIKFINIISAKKLNACEDRNMNWLSDTFSR